MARIRTVVVGLGGRGVWAASKLQDHDEFELVGLVDTIRARSELLVREMNLDALSCFDDLPTCLSSLSCDAVAIFTPDGTHADLVIQALEAGRHVFVEKPLDITADKLDAVIAADQQAGGRTFVGFNLRYAPFYQKIHQLLCDGVAGQILTIQADEFYDGGRTYFRRWNRLRAWGGGLWITKACHDFDLLNWMAGAPPRQIFANASLDYYKPRADASLYCRDCQLLADCPDRYEPSANPKLLEDPDSRGYRMNQVYEQATGQRPDLCLFNSDKDTFDHGVATVTFANQVIGSYTVNVVAGFSDRRMRVSGTKAMIEGHLAGPKLVVRHRDPSRDDEIDIPNEDGGHGGGDTKLFSAFAAFVHGRPTTYVAPTEAAIAVRMGLAARTSCDERRAVEL